jgi:hypothetical protein
LSALLLWLRRSKKADHQVRPMIRIVPAKTPEALAKRVLPEGVRLIQLAEFAFGAYPRGTLLAMETGDPRRSFRLRLAMR